MSLSIDILEEFTLDLESLKYTPTRLSFLSVSLFTSLILPPLRLASSKYIPVPLEDKFSVLSPEKVILPSLP